MKKDKRTNKIFHILYLRILTLTLCFFVFCSERTQTTNVQRYIRVKGRFWYKDKRTTTKKNKKTNTNSYKNLAILFRPIRFFIFLFGFPIFWWWVYLMNVIPETGRVHYVFIASASPVPLISPAMTVIQIKPSIALPLTTIFYIYSNQLLIAFLLFIISTL